VQAKIIVIETYYRSSGEERYFKEATVALSNLYNEVWRFASYGKNADEVIIGVLVEYENKQKFDMVVIKPSQQSFHDAGFELSVLACNMTL